MFPAIHASAISQFNRCERLWRYTNSDWGLGYRPAGENRFIQLGNWGHYALALRNRGHTMTEAVEGTKLRQAELDEKLDLVPDRSEEWTKFVNLMHAYDLWQDSDNSRYADKNLEMVYAEKTFSLEIMGVRVDGQFDGIVKHKETGELFPIEYKFTTRPDNLITGVQWDYQPRIYLLAMEQLLGVKAAGVLYTVVKNCDPTQVKILKDGLPSKAMAELTATTYEVYKAVLEQAIKRDGLDRKEVYRSYGPQLDYLATADSPIFQRRFVPFSARVQHEARRQLVTIIQRMIQAEAMGDNALPSFNRYECGRCPFKEVCQAHDTGIADPHDMLEAMFVSSQDTERFDEGLS